MIIKNCPALSQEIYGIGQICHSLEHRGTCDGIDNCLIKRIIKKLDNLMDVYPECSGLVVDIFKEDLQ